MIRLYPTGRAVVPASMGQRRCWNCRKCERVAESQTGKCELRVALHGTDSGEGRIWTDKACENWTRRDA